MDLKDSYYVFAVIGMVSSVGIVWGMMKSTVNTIRSEVQTLKDLLPDFAALKVTVEDLSNDFSMLRATLEETRNALTEVRIQTARKSRLKARKVR